MIVEIGRLIMMSDYRWLSLMEIANTAEGFGEKIKSYWLVAVKKAKEDMEAIAKKRAENVED